MSQVPRNDDKYARESFSFRRMKSWQVWTMTAIVVVLFVLAFAMW